MSKLPTETPPQPTLLPQEPPPGYYSNQSSAVQQPVPFPQDPPPAYYTTMSASSAVSFTQSPSVYENTLAGVQIQMTPTVPVYNVTSRVPQVQVIHTSTILQSNKCPVKVTCPYCQYLGFTKCRFSPGLLTWGMCIALILVGCGFGCCFIPFCVEPLQDCTHMCSNCNRDIATCKSMDV